MRLARRSAQGFTLIELTVVIGIVAILSAFAISRINTDSFNTEGFANQAAAAIRYAQKIAVSQRRNVTVTVSAGSVALSYPDIGTPVRQPPGTDPFTIAKPSGVTLSGTLVGNTVTFSALGKPTATTLPATLIVSGGDIAPKTITIVAETGYVQYVP